MSSYLLSELGDNLPKEADSETLTINVHYPEWIIDSHRISIEQAIESYFSAWVDFILREENPADYIGEQDWSSFRQAMGQISASIAHLPLPDQYMKETYAGFILSDVSSGGFKGKRHIVILLSALMSGAASGVAGYVLACAAERNRKPA